MKSILGWITAAVALLAIIVSIVTFSDTGSKVAAAAETANSAAVQSSAAMAEASQARIVADRADDKASTALNIANTALQVANNAGRGDLAAIVAVVGVVAVVLGLALGVFGLIAYSMRNSYLVAMAQISSRFQQPQIGPGIFYDDLGRQWYEHNQRRDALRLPGPRE